jgi:hypothetical protein
MPGGRTQASVDWAEHLEQYEDRSGKCKRTGEKIATLYRTDQHAHCNRKGRRQYASQQQDNPPSCSEARVGLRQDTEEFPFLALGQSLVEPSGRAVAHVSADRLE